MTEELFSHPERSELKTVIQQVKSELREQNQRMLITRKEVVIRLGKAFERETSDPEWICEEIKNALKNEILGKLISNRDIERYCFPKWKKKTKPTKEKQNDNLSFSKEEKQPLLIATVDGRTILENKEDSETNEKKPVIFESEYEEVELVDEGSNCEEESNPCKLIDNDYSDFEFSLQYDKVQKYMADQFNNHNGTKPVWIHGKLDKVTGKIMNADLGRISGQR